MELQIVHRHLGHLAHLGIGQFRVSIEQQKEEHLVGGAVELILSARTKLSLQLGRTKAELPVKLSAIVEFVVVELGETRHCLGEFAG